MPATNDVLRLHLGVLSRSPEGRVLRVLVDLARETVRAEEASLLVLDARRGRLVFAMTSGSRASEQVLLGQGVPLGRGITGMAAATGQVQIGAPTYRDVRQRRRRGRAGSDPTAVLAAPMLVGGEVVGVLTATKFGARDRFGGADADTYARVAAVAGVVVDQERRLRSLERAARGRPARPASAAERDLARVVDAVTRLSRGSPARLRRVADLVGAVEALALGDRP